MSPPNHHIKLLPAPRSAPDSSPTPEPYFNSVPLAVTEAKRRLKEIIGEWMERAYPALGNPVQIGIKGAAGLGKTRAVVSTLAEEGYIQHLHVEVYAPTHDLCSEWAKNLKEEAPHLNVIHIKGRTQRGMCEKSDLAEKIGRLGLSVQSTLCRQQKKDGTFEECEFFSSCPYQAQFADTSPAVRIFPHDYLMLHRLEGSPKPNLCVVDESFFRSAIGKTALPLHRLVQKASHSKEPIEGGEAVHRISRLIRDTLEAGKPLKKTLRESGITREDLEGCAKADFDGVPPINPSMSEAEQRSILNKIRRRESWKRAKLFKILAEEIDLPGDEFVRMHYKPESRWRGEEEDWIFLTWQRDLRIRHNSALLIDADHDLEINKKFFPFLEAHEIPVERNAEIIQVRDKPCSKLHLLGTKRDQDRAKNRRDDIQALLDAEAWQGKKVLLVGNKKVIMEENPKGDGGLASRFELPPDCDVGWFQGIYGIDRWKEFDVIILAGREQAPMDVYEDMARALWWDRKKPLRFLGPGEKPHKETRVYRMRDGSTPSVEVDVHPDPDVQRLIEQQRELQCAQAIDRLRLVHNEHRKRVLVLTNLPLDVTVDQLVTWRQMMPSRFARAFLRHGVLPTSSNELARCFPDLWSTPKAAESDFNRQKNTLIVLLEYLIRERGYLTEATYRRPGQRGRPTRAIISTTCEDPRSSLEALVGPITSFEIDT